MNNGSAPGIIFVAGLARSGTTLVQTILTKSPMVFSFPETHYFEAVRSLGLYGESLDMEKIRQLGDELFRRNGVTKSDWQEVVNALHEREIENTSIKSLFFILIDVLRRKQKAKNNLIALEKTPGHVFDIDHIVKLFPSAKILLLRRNPRDYANSISQCSWAPSTIDGIAKLWCETVLQVNDLSSRYHKKILVVDYEDVIETPQYSVEIMFDFLGLKFNKAYLENLSQTASELISDEETTWKDKNLSFDSIQSVDSPLRLTTVERFKIAMRVLPKVSQLYGFKRFRV